MDARCPYVKKYTMITNKNKMGKIAMSYSARDCDSDCKNGIRTINLYSLALVDARLCHTLPHIDIPILAVCRMFVL